MKAENNKFVQTTNAKLELSAVLISLNEEANIARAIRSVEGLVSEVLVYDSGSKDKTCEIAAKMGAKVVSGDWLGFGPSKRHASSLAKNDWILSLDCDEEVSTELANELRQKFATLEPEKAYRFPRLSRYLKTWIRHGGWYPDYQVRLFNRREANWNTAQIHEKVEAKVYETFTCCLNHYVFKNIEHQVATNNKYSTLQAEQMFASGKKFSWFHFLTKPTVKFVECYFLKLGFLDSWAGFVIARSAAYSVFLKWAKLREREKQL